MCQWAYSVFKLNKGVSTSACPPKVFGGSGFNCSLKVCFLNLRSIVNKFDDFISEVSSIDPVIIGVTESWLYPEISSAEFHIPGYNIFRQDRADTLNGRGGGVVLYVKECFDCVDRTVELSSGFQNCVICELSLKNDNSTSSILIGVFYRSPNSSDANNQNLFNCLRGVSSRRVVFFGDFNYPDIDWLTISSGSHGRDFLDCVSDCFFMQHVLFPTRGSNCLDLVLCNDENIVRNVQNCGKVSTCDHDLISFELNVLTETCNSKINIPNFHKADFDSIRDSLSVDWSLILSDLDSIESWEVVKSTILKTVDSFVPFSRKVRNPNRPLWLTRDVLSAIRKKRKLWRCYKLSGLNHDFLKFKEQEVFTKGLIREAKLNFEVKLARNVKSNPKAFYSYVRSKQSSKDVVGPLLDTGGSIISNPIGMAEVLNSYFSSVFTVESPLENLPDSVSNNVDSTLGEVDFSTDIVLKKLSNLNSNKAPGPDGIHPIILQRCSDLLALPLSIVFSKCFSSGLVPHDWKIANVTPIFKKGDHGSPANYRPVSLTSVVCKVMESIIKDSVLDHLLSNNLLNLSQFGFLPKRSCVSNLLQFLDDVTHLVDTQHNVDVVYLDFQKAFDKVPLRRLLYKTSSLGITGKCLNWIESWLSGRSQRVCVSGAMSSWQSVTSGVPQGSVLGPLLFLIFINDLDGNLGSSIYKFADDTKLFRVVDNSSDSSLLQDDLNRLVDWANFWQMSFNVSKCKVMHVGSGNCRFEYHMGDVVLDSVDQERDLGVVVSNSLKPSKQCSLAASKANRMLGMIKRNFSHFSKDIVLGLYKQIVRPHLEYAIQAWCPHYEHDKFILEQVQRRATRLITGLGHLPYEDRLRQLGLTTLNLRRVRGDMIQVFKFLTDDSSLGTCNFLKINTSTRTRGHSFKLCKGTSRLDIRKYSFSYRVVNEWNSLPDWVVNSTSVLNFKVNIDKHFTSIGRI